MKKLFALILALVLVTVGFAGNVRAAEFLELPAVPQEHDYSFPEVLAKNKSALDKLVQSDNPDVVTINEEEGFYRVALNTVTLEVTVPFGCVCITQDVLQQLSLYSSMYSNIGNAYNYYLNRNIHMDIYDIITEQDTMVYVEDNSLAQFLGNISELTDSNLNNILKYVSTNWYSNVPGSVERINGQVYFVFDFREQNGFVLYETFVGGMDISVCGYLGADDAEGMEVLRSLLDDLAIYENA